MWFVVGALSMLVALLVVAVGWLWSEMWAQERLNDNMLYDIADNKQELRTHSHALKNHKKWINRIHQLIRRDYTEEDEIEDAVEQIREGVTWQ